MTKNAKAMHYILVAALAIVFISFGIWEIINPVYWNSFVPQFLSSFNINLLVTLHGIALTLIGIWLVIGIYPKVSSIISELLMVEICITLLIESGLTDLFVRDFAILLIAAALIVEAFSGDAAAAKKPLS